ncbi:MAG: DUF1207 domain-containing protein [Gemmatimonadota bacterium]
MTCPRRTAARASIVALAFLIRASSAEAEQEAHAPRGAGHSESEEPAASAGVRWFPQSAAFAPVLAAPREVGFRGSILLADRPDSDFEGRSVEAEVAIGHRIPVVRLQGEAPGRAAVVIGFEVGMFSRFSMETSEKDLINTDFRVGVPLSLRGGRWEGRATILHVSSHIGDEFIARFPRPQQQVTRDGFEGLLALRFGPSLRLYGGADYNFHANSGVERAAGRFGLEWNPGFGAERGFAWPFAATDFQVTTEAERVAGTGTAGVAFRIGGTALRLEARGHFGPSPIGQLRAEDEDFLGLGLRVEP